MPRISWFTISAVVSLCLLILISYIGGLSNKPLAEDFDRPEVYMELGPNRNFRLTFAVSILAIQSIAGSISSNPEVYHLFGIIVHMMASLAVFYFAYYLTSSQNSALVITLFFALYPRHHEPVFWTATYAHTIMTACLLFSLNSYLKWRQEAKARWLVASMVLFALAIVSHEAAPVGIVLFLLYELFWQRDRLGLGLPRKGLTLIRLLWPFLVVVGIYISILIAARGGPLNFVRSITETDFYRVSLGWRQLRDFGGYLSYMLFLFVPLRSIDSILIKFGMLMVTGAVLGASLLWGSRLMRFGTVWMVTAFLPYVLLVPFGNSDRYFYLPSVGFCFLVVGAFQTISNFIAKRLGIRGQQLVLRIGLITLSAYMVLAFSSIQDRAREWYEAGELVDEIFTQIYTLHPTVDPTATFYFLNLPKQYKQARFMGDGTRSALAAHYNLRTLRVYTGDHPDLLAAIEKATHGSPANEQVYIYVYYNELYTSPPILKTYSHGKLVDRSYSYADPAVRAALDAYAIFP